MDERRRPNGTMRTSFLRNRLFLAIAVLALHSYTVSASMVVDIDTGGRTCYALRVPDDRPSIISGNFDLLDDSADGSIVTAMLTKLMGKDGKETTTIWTSEQEESEDTFSITVDPIGRYAFCIAIDPPNDDDEDYEDNYPVGFNLRLDPLPRSLPQEESGPEAQRGMRLIESASFIENDWRNLLDHFDYLRSREAVYVQLTNQTADRLMGWNIVEALLVVTMAVGQVIYWKKFFETRRYL